MVVQINLSKMIFKLDKTTYALDKISFHKAIKYIYIIINLDLH